MYNVLIVDDEMLVQIGVKSLINTEESNIDVIETVSNGLQAFEMLKNNIYHVVVTDIIMPMMDGLALIEKCRLELPYSPQFILLTSHEDFGYARRAITLGAVDYLIKLDLNIETLKHALDNAIESWEAANISLTPEKTNTVNPINISSYNTDKFLNSIISGFNVAEQDIREFCITNNFMNDTMIIIIYFEIVPNNQVNQTKKDKEYLYKCVYDSVKKTLSRDTSDCYFCEQNHDSFFAIYNTVSKSKYESKVKGILQDTLNRAISINRKYFNTELLIGVSTIGSIVEFKRLFCESRNSLKDYTSNGNIHYSITSSSKDYEEALFNEKDFARSVLFAFETDSIKQLNQLFSDLSNHISNMHLPYEKVSETCNFLVYYLLANSDECKNIIHKMVPADSHIVTLMNSLKNTIQIVDWMMRLNDNLQQQIECNSKDFTMRLVSQAKNIIDDNLDKQLLLSDIAATLGISPSYLSTIFKKCTDRGFVDYITERKMKKAVELFLSKSLKIFEVAQLLGYDNAYYFSKVFKKQYGMSPKSFIAKRKT